MKFKYALISSSDLYAAEACKNNEGWLIWKKNYPINLFNIDEKFTRIICWELFISSAATFNSNKGSILNSRWRVASSLSRDNFDCHRLPYKGGNPPKCSKFWRSKWWVTFSFAGESRSIAQIISSILNAK
jgi:hypothetical protein